MSVRVSRGLSEPGDGSSSASVDQQRCQSAEEDWCMSPQRSYPHPSGTTPGQSARQCEDWQDANLRSHPGLPGAHSMFDLCKKRINNNYWDNHDDLKHFVFMKADKRLITGNHCGSHHREVSFLHTDEQEGGGKRGQSRAVIGQLRSPDHIRRIPGVHTVFCGRQRLHFEPCIYFGSMWA